MNEPNIPVVMPDPTAVPAAAVRELDLRGLVDRRRKILEVVAAVMKENVHFGVVPGCRKPSLYQPGAEVLASTFMLRPRLRVEDLSSPTEIRYRVHAEIIHYPTGEIVGEGLGECSSSEEKYAWRKAICDEEWGSFPETQRRIKFKEVWSGPKGKRIQHVEQVKQVRTNPADVANTILLMATKRCTVKGIRSTVGASDIFTQGVEDLPDLSMAEESEAEKPEPETPAGNGGTKAPASEKATANAPVDSMPADVAQGILAAWHDRGPISEKQKARLFAIAAQSGWNGDAVAHTIEASLNVRPDDLPWGKPYDLTVKFFEEYEPSEGVA